ncbi:MAG: ATP-binding cassette domain-containing protein [Gemmatimonadetes bacterium]|nr:ATP-binding cassette domain-containing protein [Gemmatimonadota bacterium]
MITRGKAMSLLTLQGVSKAFGDITAVDDVSFSVDRGQVVGFLGPNGAGKSTTMRLITQFFDPDAGEILLDGVPLATDTLAAKRRIGYLPENNPLYTDMVVGDYLTFIARLRGLVGAAATAAIGDAVGATAAEEVYYRPIGDLSKGYRQRVGLAQAILHKPDLLVLDEPTEGLDPSQRVEIGHLIEGLGQDRTVILSTHVLSEVTRTCSRLLIINRGSIVADGLVDVLVAQATGSVQILVEAEGDGVAGGLGSLEGVQLVTPRESSVPGSTAVSVTVGGGHDVRPKIFEMAKDRGWTLYELFQETRSLEDLFLELTADDDDQSSPGDGQASEAA